MSEYVLKSGATLIVSMSPFEIGNALRKSVTRALKGEPDTLSESAISLLVSDDEVERRERELGSGQVAAISHEEFVRRVQQERGR